MGALQRFWRFLRLMRSGIIATLVSVNLLMAMYTIPLLMNGGGRRPLQHEEDLMKGDLFRRSQEGMILKNNNSARSVDFKFDGSGDYSHEYFYLLQPTTGCEEDISFLLIVVCSAVHHFDLRLAIRETWATSIHKNEKLPTKLVFMLGVPSKEYSHLQQQVVKESITYGDVIQEDFVDSYVNLTLKSIGALKWATSFCPDAKYVVKTDDDIFVNIPNLITLLMDVSMQAHSSRFLLGNVIQNAKPITDRHSKWYTPSTIFKDKSYPKYLSGSAYVISGDIVIELYTAATMRKPFWLEDIFITGLLASDLDIDLLHNRKFTYRRPKMPHPCFYKTVATAHELSADSLRHIWGDLLTDDQDCSHYQSDMS